MKTIYTIPELCKKLGNKATFTRYRVVDGILQGLYYGSWIKILSVGDTIEMDECGRCGNKLCSHINVTSSRKKENGDYCPGMPFKDTEIVPSNKFKPISQTVKQIVLIESCECGHPKDYHNDNIEFASESGNTICCRSNCKYSGCRCGKYKPVQKVEIEVD